MTLTTQYDIGQFVEHVLDATGSPGLIVAFMVRGANHSYSVQWDAQKEPQWNFEFELRPHTKREAIAIPIKTEP